MTGRAGYDPALANERTSLAWTRSALALLANAGLVLHAGLRSEPSVLALAATVALMLTALAVWRHGNRLYTARLAEPRYGAQPHAVTALTATSLALAAIAAVVLLA